MYSDVCAVIPNFPSCLFYPHPSVLGPRNAFRITGEISQCDMAINTTGPLHELKKGILFDRSSSSHLPPPLIDAAENNHIWAQGLGFPRCKFLHRRFRPWTHVGLGKRLAAPE